MKSVKTIKRLALLILMGIAIFAGCELIEDYIGSTSSEECPDSISTNPVDNQLIIKFSPDFADSLRTYYYTYLADLFGTETYTTRHCDCDTNLVLYNAEDANEGIDMEKLASRANDRTVLEGDAYFNFNINLDPSFSTLQTGIYENKNYQYVPEDLVVAIIDGGLTEEYFDADMFDPEFSYDFTEDWQEKSTEYDIQPHGTLVGRIIADELKESGIPFKLLDLRVFDKEGNGNLFNAICATSYAVQNNVDLINMSWGYHREVTDTLFLNYLEKAKNAGIIVVSSAGNETVNTDECLHFPSGFNARLYNLRLGNVLSVASLGADSINLAPYSNYGGASIGIASGEGFTGFIDLDAKGTSFAAPVVISVALKLMATTSGSNTEIVSCILDNAEVTEELEGKVISNGKLNTEYIDCGF